VPVAYLTAYYALLMRGGMRSGQRVLVHSGTGAVGLAAIRIARFRGCEVRRPVRTLQSSTAAKTCSPSAAWRARLLPSARAGRRSTRW
jgi:NADPH:quinone reductase-like Zn-dependent oxidoreductase